MSENRFEDIKFPKVVFNSLSEAKRKELLENGQIEEGEWYVTNDGFKDNAGGLDVLDIGQSLYIDETQGLRRWLNGSWVDINDHTRPFYEKLLKASSLYPDILCTPSEYENIIAQSAFNQCGKFAIDTVSGKIRLPKIVYANGALNISNIGNLGSERILVAKKEPTETEKSWWNWYSDGWYEEGGYMYTTGSATGSDQQRDIYFSHNFRDRNYNVYLASGVGNSGWQYANGAMLGSGSNLNYDNWQFVDHFHMCLPTGTTNTYCYWRVEGYANKPTEADFTIDVGPIQYYYIQIATGLETVVNIENEVQLNNPYSLGESMYSASILNNISWLRGGSHSDRVTYPSYYDMLYKILTGEYSIAGITVKEEGDATIDRLDHVINTHDETFILPTLNGSENVRTEDRSNFIDYTSQITATGAQITAPYNGWFRIYGDYAENKYIELFNQSTDMHALGCPASSGLMVYADIWANKGDIVSVYYNTAITSCNFRIATKPGFLYFYVGETVQNANLINAGKLTDTASTTMGQWDGVSNRTYCRRYADGWCEQGGYYYTGATLANTNIVVTFPQPFKDNNYVFSFNHVYPGNGTADCGCENWTGHKPTSATVYNGTGGWQGFSWRASGYYK